MQIFEVIGDIKDKNILLLQGPMGAFFNFLDKKFTSQGAKTFRIGFNAGDEFFSDTKHFTPYRDKPSEWEKFISDYLRSHAIDLIFLFGDCRYYQRLAIKIAKEMGVRVFIFEEGYIRPDFITIEENGVNDHSSLPRNREFYDALIYSEEAQCNYKNAKHIGSTYKIMALQAAAYYVVARMFRFKYPYYEHHKNFSAFLELFYGVRNFLRKQLYSVQEAGLEHAFSDEYSKRYYFVALQTHDDFQIKEHSKYKNMEEFILEVLQSFAKYAPKDRYLVIKHHPMDRGKKDYKPFIKKHASELGCSERVKVVHDVHLPTLLKHSIATITVNSTVGISSLYHNIPTKCMGNALYDIEGMTSKHVSLDDFWENYEEVDSELFQKFRCYLIQHTQINSTFYFWNYGRFSLK